MWRSRLHQKEHPPAGNKMPSLMRIAPCESCSLHQSPLALACAQSAERPFLMHERPGACSVAGRSVARQTFGNGDKPEKCRCRHEHEKTRKDPRKTLPKMAQQAKQSGAAMQGTRRLALRALWRSRSDPQAGRGRKTTPYRVPACRACEPARSPI